MLPSCLSCFEQKFGNVFPTPIASCDTQMNLDDAAFLIFTGSLESHDTIYLAADKHIICDFEASLVESALALLATYYVFMYNYPPGLTNFFIFLQKCILHIQDGKKLPSSVISLVNYFHEHQPVSATCCASRSV